MTRARYFAINYLPIYRDSPKQASPRDPGAASLLIVYLRPPAVLSRARRLSHPPPLSRYPSLSLSPSLVYESITGYTRNSRTSPWNRPQHTLITDANGIIASIAGSYSLSFARPPARPLARSLARCSYETATTVYKTYMHRHIRAVYTHIRTRVTLLSAHMLVGRLS